MAKILTKAEAIRQITQGSSVMIGGFMSCGTPIELVSELAEQGVKELTVISNDTGMENEGIGVLIHADAVSKLITSHIGTNPETGRKMIEGKIEVNLVPQGTLAEQIRAKGAGLGGILTPTGVGTIVAEGKEEITVKGEKYLLEEPIGADFALVKAWKADKKGNLIYQKSARNFNPLMATAAQTVIVEVDELVEVGEIDPNEVMTPGLFVDYLVKGGREDGR